MKINKTQKNLSQPVPSVNKLSSSSTQPTLMTGELRIRQLQYTKSSMDAKSIQTISFPPIVFNTETEQRAMSLGPSQLQIHTHMYSNRLRRIPGRNATEMQSQFFENFIPQQDSLAATQVLHVNVIPDEEEVRRTFKFKLPCIVQNQEKQGVQTHFLENFIQPQELIDSYIGECRRYIQQIKDEKERVRKELPIMEDKCLKSIEQTTQEAKIGIERLKRAIKEDYVAHQTEQFRLNKQIMLLLKDKLNLEKEIEITQVRVLRQELNLQGVECYGLQTEDQGIQTMSLNNLRQDLQNTTLKGIIH